MSTPQPPQAPPRSLADRFADLHPDLQAALYAVLRVAIGMGHDEKTQAVEALDMTRAAMERLGQPRPALDAMEALSSLLVWADVAALGGCRTPIAFVDALSTLREAGELASKDGANDA